MECPWQEGCATKQKNIPQVWARETCLRTFSSTGLSSSSSLSLSFLGGTFWDLRKVSCGTSRACRPGNMPHAEKSLCMAVSLLRHWLMSSICPRAWNLFNQHHGFLDSSDVVGFSDWWTQSTRSTKIFNLVVLMENWMHPGCQDLSGSWDVQDVCQCGLWVQVSLVKSLRGFKGICEEQIQGSMWEKRRVKARCDWAKK